ncbi:MAG: type VI secretion system-associated FHA domain protein TagH [Pseudomonadota bacterium]
MPLTLRILTYRKQAPTEPVERRFDQLGGTIGRAAGNDLELPDPGKYISRNHSKIDFIDGRFTLMDLGSNPSWINDRPVGAGKTAPLEHGDRLLIGDYVLDVLVDQAGAPAPLPVFQPETSDALPFQAQPAVAPSLYEGKSFDEMRDTLAGVKILDVASGAYDPLAAPSTSDPLGLNMLHEGNAAQAAPPPVAFRGSEPDHISPQFMPMPAARLPGQPVPVAPPPAPGYPAYQPPQASPFSDPTMLTMHPGPAAGVQAAALPPSAPSMMIPDDYDPLADFLPPRMAAPAAPPPYGQAPGHGAPQAFGGAAPAAYPPSYPPAYPPAYQQPQPGHAAQHGLAPGGMHGHAPQPQPMAQGGFMNPYSGGQAGQGQYGDSEVLHALLRGLGLPALKTTKSPVETAELVGAMLREATAGTMAVLLARAMTKRESRLEMTVLGAQANNPLKFFPDAESALSQMLTNAMSGYMPPVKSIGSAFDDLKAHELAVIAGMRAALDGVLARFNPTLIEAKEPEGVMDKMMTTARKARMWDRMVTLYDDILREADDDFQHLFGDKFSAAYEDQIGRLHRK